MIHCKTHNDSTTAYVNKEKWPKVSTRYQDWIGAYQYFLTARSGLTLRITYQSQVFGSLRFVDSVARTIAHLLVGYCALFPLIRDTVISDNYVYMVKTNPSL
jgi:hypothetical protein